MLSHTHSVLSEADKHAAGGAESKEVFRLLQKLTLEEFGQLLLKVPEKYAALLSLLPKMPAESDQQIWTGSSGIELLKTSCAYLRSTELGFLKHRGTALQHARVLDYGCGWGRLARLLLWYTDPDRIYAVDPWDRSIEICRENGLPGNFELIDYLPKALPDSYNDFDIIIAFSVFTHLSEKTANTVLRTLRNVIKPGGLLSLTIRPVEYWDIHAQYLDGFSRSSLTYAHNHSGYSFMPHNRVPIDGEVTYGDSSVSFEYIRQNWKDWNLLGYDFNLVDPYQLILFLEPQ